MFICSHSSTILILWKLAKASDQSLPDLPNQPDFSGEQFVVDETGEFIRSDPRLLLTSTNFSIDEIFERVNALGGLVIPAHVETDFVWSLSQPGPDLGRMERACPGDLTP